MDSKIVADEGLLAKVRGVTSPTVVCDASGNAVAVVMSPEQYKDLLLTGTGRHFQPELAERSWQYYLQNGGQSTAEVLAKLKTLDGGPGAKP
jgi:hypothetical protein